MLKREAMGFGDVILMATIGSFLGWQPTLVVFFLAPVCAWSWSRRCWLFRRDREIPYGPYLSLATLIVLVGWKHIWPAAERVFSLGLFVPAMGLVMCVLLYLSLQIDAVDEAAAWAFPTSSPRRPTSGNRATSSSISPATTPTAKTPAWTRPQWPGVGSARGSLFEQAWRNGRSQE